jgi:SAM-dependent methyltransferase
MTMVQWQEAGCARAAHWRSAAGVAAPKRVRPVDAELALERAYVLACEGTALLWRGDWASARRLLQWLGRRLDRRPPQLPPPDAPPGAGFHLHRKSQAERARLLGLVLVPLTGDFGVALAGAPDTREACAAAWGAADGTPTVVALRELLGVWGAWGWQQSGVLVPALGPEVRIHPHYGVFSPVRGEYLDLVAAEPLPTGCEPPGPSLAFDIGTGTGVLAALLARRGVQRVVATDTEPRALACAADNLDRLGLRQRVELREGDLFPPGRAPLVVCNPPWLPVRAHAPLERALYDEGSRMLRGFLGGLAAHLTAGGEGWLLLSNFAELLGLRGEGELARWIADAGLEVRGQRQTRPVHGKSRDVDDPLHAARAAEVTSLWRLGVRDTA